MKRLLLVALILFIASSCSPSTNSDNTTTSTESTTTSPVSSEIKTVTAGWTVTDSMEAPESAYWDAASGFIFVSQITGAADDRDGTGRITKLEADGTIVSPEWVAGLNAPKGLRSCNGNLWIADIDEVVGVDISTGRTVSRIKVDGASFLNDVACDKDGTLYVSDTLLSRIYRIKDDQVSLFAEGDDLEFPNGLLVEGNRLIVAAWGKPEPDFTTKVPGRLFSLDLQTKEKTLITPEPGGNLDGVEIDGKGGYIVTDWIAGKVLQITSAGDIHTLREFEPGTADHAFITTGNVLILPHMSENKVGAYDLSEVLR